MQFRRKRIYEPASDDDGVRWLVDRLWPRGITKSAAQLDLWLKEFAPSSELRRWFHQHADAYDEFARRYRFELEQHRAPLMEILAKVSTPCITLLTAARSLDSSHILVVEAFLRDLRQRP